MYEVKETFLKVQDFVLCCPFLEEFGVVFNKESAPETSDSNVITAELSYQGSLDVKTSNEVTGGASISRREVFHIKLIHNPSCESERINLFGFIDNFQQWVDYAHHNGQTVEIYGDEKTSVWAESYFEQSNATDDCRYIIRLNIIHEKSYE